MNSALWKSINIKRLLLSLYLGLGFALCLIDAIQGKPADKTVAFGYFGSVITTLVAWFVLKYVRRQSLALKRPKLVFILAGSVMAAWVETIFWAFERLFGATGVAAHPNLAIDLLFTMPWYIGMVWLLYGVQKRCRFVWWKLALLGGVYELAADGIFGGMILSDKFPISDSPMLILAFPIFAGVYSAIILPAVWLVFGEQEREEATDSVFKLKQALKPLWALLIYAAVLLTLFSSDLGK